MIISHRGKIFTNQITENTLDDFKQAVDLGVCGFETDLRKTKDNHIIIHHDSTIDGKEIQSLLLNEVLNIKKVAKLEELLDFCVIAKENLGWHGLINLEIKTFGQTKEIIDILKKYPKLEDQLLISSFLHPVVWEIKKQLKYVKTGLLYRSFLDTFGGYFFKKPDYLILYKDTIALDNKSFKKFSKFCKFRRIKLLTYKLKNASEFKFFKDLDGVIADCTYDLIIKK